MPLTVSICKTFFYFYVVVSDSDFHFAYLNQKPLSETLCYAIISMPCRIICQKNFSFHQFFFLHCLKMKTFFFIFQFHTELFHFFVLQIYTLVCRARLFSVFLRKPSIRYLESFVGMYAFVVAIRSCGSLHCKVGWMKSRQ